MASGELVARYVLDDSDILRGLSRVEKMAEVHARKESAVAATIASSYRKTYREIVDGNLNRFAITDGDMESGLRNIDRYASAQEEMASRGSHVSNRIRASFRKTFLEVGNVGRASMLGVSAAVGLAGKAIGDYAEKNSYAAAELSKVEAASSRFWTSIGRDISAGGTGPLSEFIDMLGKAREQLTDDIADNFNGGSSAEISEEMKKAEASQKEFARERRKGEIEDASKQRMLELNGDPLKVADAKANAAYKARMAEIKALGPGGDTKGLEAQALKEGQLIYQKAVEEANQKKQAERERKEVADEEARQQAENSEAEKTRRREALEDAREQSDFQLKALEVERLKADGQKDAADILREQLSTAEDIARVNHNDQLTMERKAELIVAINATSESKLKALERGDTKEPNQRLYTRSVSVGANAGLLGQVFGNGGGANPMLSEAKTQTVLLRQIAQKVGGAAVFG